PRSADRKRGLTPFQLQQALLAPQAAAVADRRAVLADDAVAGDPDRDAVHAVGAADGAYRLGGVDGVRDVGVGAHLAVRDRQQRLPDPLLERRSGSMEREREDLPLSVEILG